MLDERSDGRSCRLDPGPMWRGAISAPLCAARCVLTTASGAALLLVVVLADAWSSAPEDEGLARVLYLLGRWAEVLRAAGEVVACP